MAATFERPSVTTALAKAIIEAAEQKAAEMGHPFVIAVVDDSGVLKAFSRMDCPLWPPFNRYPEGGTYDHRCRGHARSCHAPALHP
jgi:hypothetical protein